MKPWYFLMVTLLMCESNIQNLLSRTMRDWNLLAGQFQKPRNIMQTQPLSSARIYIRCTQGEKMTQGTRRPNYRVNMNNSSWSKQHRQNGPLVLNSPHLTPARDQTCSFYQEQNVFQFFLPGLMKHVISIRSITYSESYLSQVVNLLLKAVNPNGPPPRAKGSVPCTQTDVTFQDPGRFVCLFQSVDSFDVI